MLDVDPRDGGVVNVGILIGVRSRQARDERSMGSRIASVGMCVAVDGSSTMSWGEERNGAVEYTAL